MACPEITFETLHEGFNPSVIVKRSELLEFDTPPGVDAYNITAPFWDEGREVIAARYEKRGDEVSTTKFCVEKNGIWSPDDSYPSYHLQDPFVKKMGRLLVLGGVEVINDGTNKQSYRTKLYAGENLRSQVHVFDGPLGMKDLRLVQLPDDTIGVFTRPQGNASSSKGGRGQIGFKRFNSLDQLSTEHIDEAPLINNDIGIFTEEQWGGVNEVYVLGESFKLGVLGHIARWNGEAKQYSSFTFVYDYRTDEVTSAKLIATRECFPEAAAKHHTIQDVIFSGGLRLSRARAILYAGLSDAAAGRCVIPNPFI